MHLSSAQRDQEGPQGDPGEPGDDGAPGADGEDGADGAAGVGVPTGGTAGQHLAKIDGTNYNTEWVDAEGGGSQVLGEDEFAETDPITDYPVGDSTMQVSAAANWDGIDEPAIIRTVRTEDTAGSEAQGGFQWMHVFEAGLAIRGWSPPAGDPPSEPGWMPWRYVTTNDALENFLFAWDLYLLEDSLYATAPITDFPRELTILPVTGAFDWGPNTGEAGHVITSRNGSEGKQDFVVPATGTTYTRYYDSGVWGAWSSGGGSSDADTLDGHDSAYFATATGLSGHIGDTTDAHDASAISVLDTAAQYAATNVEDALAEVLDGLQAHEVAADPHTQYLKESDFTKAAIDALNVDADTLDGIDSTGFATASGLSDHIGDTTDAHDASAISYAGSTNLAATQVEAALDELDTEKLATSSYTAADVLSKLLTVDGSGSGLDADLLDGNSSAAFQLLTGKDAASGYVGRDANGGADLNYLKFDRQASAPATPGDPGANIYTYSQDGITVLEGRTETGGIFRFLRDQADIGYNSTGAAITKGSLVRVTGWDAVRAEPTIALASNDALATMHAAGMATADIPNNTSGRLWSIGNVSSLNTNGLAVGATLYLGTGGAFTTTAPSAIGTYVQILGEVLVADATTGMVRLAISPSYTTNAASGSLSLTEVEVDLGSTPKTSGYFQITGLSGLTTGRQVLIRQALGPYTGKGTLADEYEMDTLQVGGKVASASTIDCYWTTDSLVRGNFKFAYAAG